MGVYWRLNQYIGKFISECKKDKTQAEFETIFLEKNTESPKSELRCSGGKNLFWTSNQHN